MNQVNVGDLGTEIILNCTVSIISATEAAIIVTKPDGSVAKWPATIRDMTNISHLTTVGDLDIPGAYQIQSYIKMPTWEGRGESTILEVLA